MKMILIALSSCALGAFLSFNFIAEYVDSGVTQQQLADAIYTQKIINRFSPEKHIIKTHDNWYAESMKLVESKQDRINYALLSLWAINKHNKPDNRIETEGLRAVVNNPDKPYYKSQRQGENHYFYAFYSDKAISPVCVSCHNEHKNSPKTDFTLNDVMGAIVIRIKLDKLQLKMGGLRG